MVAAGQEPPAKELPDHSFFRLYPNPTTGDFTLELREAALAGIALVTVYDSRGERVLTSSMTGLSKREFSLLGMPAGLYFISVTNGDKGATKKLLFNP